MSDRPWFRWAAASAFVVAMASLSFFGRPHFQEQAYGEPEQSPEQIESAVSPDERMADYTLALVVWTAVLAAFAGFELVYIRRQDALTRRSLDVSKQSADAAIAGQRPWLEVKNVGIFRSFEITNQGITQSTSITLFNHGNTPATNIHVFAVLAATPIRNGLDFEVALREAHQLSNNWRAIRNRLGTTIFPKAEGRGDGANTLQLSAEAIAAAAALTDADSGGRVIFLLSGCVDYSFGGGEGQTTFNYRIMADDQGVMGTTVVPKRFEGVQLREETIGVYAK